MPGRENVARSTSGSGTTRSIRSQAQKATAETTQRPKIGNDSQPHDSPFVTASSKATSATESTPAPRKSGRPPRRTGDSGTHSQISAAAPSTGAPPITNSHCQLRFSTMKPLPTRPSPPPMPNTDDMTPIATPTRSGGNSSRMIPNAKREHRRARALQHAAGDEPLERIAQGRGQRAEPEDGQTHDHQPLLAVHVAELAEQRREHRASSTGSP